MKRTNRLTGVCGLVVWLMTAIGADAAGIRVRCETRTDPPRSKISVDAKDLTPADGPFRAIVSSGRHRRATLPQAAVGDEVEFDFDSDPDDVATGATRIGATFIQGAVTGRILDAAGYEVANSTVNCRAR
jgi:hypothetical protein